jgi:hypothetical protein
MQNIVVFFRPSEKNMFYLQENDAEPYTKGIMRGKQIK